MSRFQKFTLRHISNGAVVQDGFDTYAIRESGSEVWAATSGENLSQLQVDIPDEVIKRTAKQIEFDAAVKPAEDDQIHSVGTPGLLANEVYDPKKLRWLRDHIDFAEELPAADVNRYLWDVIKMLHLVQKPT